MTVATLADWSQFLVKRVLFVLPDLRGGGAERVVLSVLRHLDSSRFAVTLFLIRRRGVLWGEIPDNVKVVWAAENESAFMVIPRALLRLLRESGSQDLIVAGLELGPTYFVYLAGLLRRKRTVGWIHTSFGPYTAPQYLTRIDSLLSRFVLKRMGRLVFVSEGSSRSMEKWLRVKNDRRRNWKVIVNIFDPSRYEREGALSRRMSKPVATVPLVVAVGRLEIAKGFDILIRAHALLLGGGVNHRVAIFGEGRDRSTLENLAASLGVKESVSMPGFVPNVIERMRNAIAFVLCSRYEGFGMVLLEAMAAGLPVISADCPTGPAEVLAGGKYGILIPPNDPTALANALRRILLDARLRECFVEAGAKRIYDFAPDRVVPAWEQLLSEFSA